MYMYWYWQAPCFIFQRSLSFLLCHAVYERLFSSLLGTSPPRPDLPDSLGSPRPMHPYHAGLRCPLPHQLVPFHSSLILSMGPTRPVQCPPSLSLPSPRPDPDRSCGSAARPEFGRWAGAFGGPWTWSDETANSGARHVWSPASERTSEWVNLGSSGCSFFCACI